MITDKKYDDIRYDIDLHQSLLEKGSMIKCIGSYNYAQRKPGKPFSS